MKHRAPADLRERAVAALAAGECRGEVVPADGLDPRTVERWLARARRGAARSARP